MLNVPTFFGKNESIFCIFFLITSHDKVEYLGRSDCMRKYTVSLLVGLMFFLGTTTYSQAFGGSDWINKDVQLTEEQKQEMAKMQMDALEHKKQIINKYVEYGVISEKKADKIVTKFEKHYAKMEENGFIPKWDKHDKHHNKCECDKED